jgi:hypothetical protein
MRTWLLGGVLTVLMAWGGYWFYQNFSLVDQTVRIGFQGEALTNPLLAAERFLNSPSHPVKSLSRFVEPPSNAMLVMTGSRIELGAHRSAALLAWVHAGGQLIVVPSNVPDDAAGAEPDALLQPFSVVRVLATLNPKWVYLPTDVILPAAPDFMQVSFAPGWKLLARGVKPAFSVMDETGTHLMRFKYGSGAVTVLSDAGFMQNDAIGRYDNAAFLWFLTHTRPAAPIWLVTAGDMPPLWKWLGTQAPLALLSASVLLVAWLWARSRRFGPLRAEAPLARRRLLEHIDASGRFLWRHGQRASLLNAARSAVWRVLEARHPAWARLPQVALTAHLAGLTQAPPAVLQLALFDPYAPNEYQFTEAISLLETIRKSL